MPVFLAMQNPFIAWRHPVYTVSSFAGIIALALLFMQPLLASGYLPQLTLRTGRRVHFWVGMTLVGMVFIHVGGLWLTNAPDVIDALLFESPTPFSVWGVLAMWASIAAAAFAALRSRLRLKPNIWRMAHIVLTAIVVLGSVMHALLIEGTMEPVSKAIICSFTVVAMILGLMSSLLRWPFSA